MFMLYMYVHNTCMWGLHYFPFTPKRHDWNLDVNNMELGKYKICRHICILLVLDLYYIMNGNWKCTIGFCWELTAEEIIPFNIKMTYCMTLKYQICMISEKNFRMFLMLDQGHSTNQDTWTFHVTSFSGFFGRLQRNSQAC